MNRLEFKLFIFLFVLLYDSLNNQFFIDFFRNVTTSNSSGFVAEEDRVAVFDNGETLWTEKPLCIPVELKQINDATGNYLVRTEKIQSLNDKQFKPANIGLHIGKKPIFTN